MSNQKFSIEFDGTDEGVGSKYDEYPKGGIGFQNELASFVWSGKYMDPIHVDLGEDADDICVILDASAFRFPDGHIPTPKEYVERFAQICTDITNVLPDLDGMGPGSVAVADSSIQL